VLSSRAAVLAAANPAFGRYDSSRSPAENVEFQGSILSRFDLIFVLLDKTDAEKDDLLAKHVFDVHEGFATAKRPGAGEKVLETGSGRTLSVALLRQYVHYARTHVFPELDEEAAEFLENEYVNLRAEADHDKGIPITVRQLEAIVRLAESLAKMELSEVATKEHAVEAVKIFRAATVKAANLGAGGASVFGSNRVQTRKIARKVEAEVRNKVAVDEVVSKKKLMFEISRAVGCDLAIVETVINNMGNNKDFEVRGKTIKRRR